MKLDYVGIAQVVFSALAGWYIEEPWARASLAGILTSQCATIAFRLQERGD